jgi:hypothetical protein
MSDDCSMTTYFKIFSKDITLGYSYNKDVTWCYFKSTRM